MASEQLPELKKGEPAHWAGEHEPDPENGSGGDKDSGPDELTGLAALSPEERADISTKLLSAIPSHRPPSVIDPDIYH